GPFAAGAAQVSILTIGAFAALNQLNIATAIVNGLFYAVLAVVVGSTIVAVGGGGIQPMHAQWVRFLNRVQHEAPSVKVEAVGGPEAQAEPWNQRPEHAYHEVGREQEEQPTF